MSAPSTAFSRVFAIGALFVVMLNVLAAGGNLFQEGFWQKIYGGAIVAFGAVLFFQLISLVATGRSGIAANYLWMMVGAFAFFTGTLNVLVAIFPDALWTNPELVNDKTKEVVVVSGFLGSGVAIAINAVLVALAAIGHTVEDSNPDLEPVS
ncbi:hypothetical protein [Sulfuriroseicoccus oceanibius]|uniref:Uncharacterized protein n=1 Tax=Sulfuriroseicoccus oceanibius TaxID=2707525 RepID=A0A7T7F038_9BACT|nr:hypothetical protein [Sulfuriroseicoccus oceanibius]QQL44242.1 hypothetical protein G3M56_010090 [Sulfuriroseicoccus oceanibius]